MENYELPELEKMRAGVDYFFPVSLRKFTAALRPLSNSEMMECYANITEYLNDIPKNRRTKLDEDNALAREILKKASAPFDRPQDNKITDPMLDRMTTDEIMYFYNEWRGVCDRVNPSLEKIPMETLRATVEELKKNPPTDLDAQLTELSFGQLVNLARYFLISDDSPTVK